MEGREGSNFSHCGTHCPRPVKELWQGPHLGQDLAPIQSPVCLQKREWKNVEVKGHCCSCRPGSLPSGSQFAESRDLESCVFCYIFVETQRKAGREELPTGFEAQREGCLVGQAKSHPLPLKLGLPSVTQPIIFLT